MSTKTTNRRRKQAVEDSLGKFILLGEIITWKPPYGGTTQAAIVQALKDSGLDETTAKDLTPQAAFTRACKAMEEDRSIDTLPKDGEWLRFQFTKKAVISDGSMEFEVQFRKESIVRVNSLTGEVKCKVPQLKEMAEVQLKKHLETRNGSDVTNIVTKLFEKQLHELIHVDAGVYFVPAEHATFTAQVDGFLRRINGSVNRFPIPKGTQEGDRSVQSAVSAHFENLIAEHKEAVSLLSVYSRQNALDAAAERINGTRVKVEAYAQYLSDRREELLASLDEANEELRKQVEDISGVKEKEKSERNGASVTKDRFGSRPGTRYALINAAIDKTPKGVDQIMEEIGSKHRPSVRAHLANLVVKGFVEKLSGRLYCLADKNY